MLNGFRSSGGLARLSEVVDLSERRGGLDIALLVADDVGNAIWRVTAQP